MLRILAVAVLALYGIACWGTMPSQCFTIQHAVTCQRVQLGAIFGWRVLNWDFVHSIRRVG